MIWVDDKKYEEHLEELAEWDEINASMPENNSYLKGLYVWNEGEDNYISYEFCEEETGQACAAFICIKERVMAESILPFWKCRCKELM